MFKPMIAGITALSLTLATATPSYANSLDRDDVGKLLFGLAAVAIVGAALDNREQRRDRARERARDRTPEPVQRGIDPNRTWADLNREQGQRNARRALPQSCLRTVETRYGAQRLFGQRCLEQNYRHVNRLPDLCEIRVYTNTGPRRGYDPLCLREQGFRSDRRH